SSAASLPHTLEVQVTSRLPVIWEGTRLHAGILLALLAVGVMAFITYRTAFGFKARTVGFSPSAARYAGMSVVPVITLAMLISGGLAGLAGTVEVLGVQRRLRDQFLTGTGYTAIAIALFGRNDPLGIALAAVLFGALEAGASNMEALAGVPSTLVEIIQAVIIFLVAVSVSLPPGTLAGWRKRLARRGPAEPAISGGAHES
ncbi:MAG: ABC transporter permease, partial [Chloroflexota bacterium]